MPPETDALSRIDERSGTTPATTANEEAAPSVAHGCWLSADVLLLVTTSLKPADDQVEAFAECGSRTIRLASSELSFRSPDQTEPSTHLGRVVLVRLPAGHTAADSLSLTLRVADESTGLSELDLAQVTLSLDALLRFHLAALGPVERADMLAFLVAGPGIAKKVGSGRRSGCCAKTSAEQVPFGQLRLSKSLYTARQALRERLPACVISVDASQGLSVDTVLAVDQRSFYVQGWMRDAEAPPARLTAVSPEGGRYELLPRLYRYRRPDVEEFYGESTNVNFDGWIAYVETPGASLLAGGWTFEMSNAAGSEVEVTGPDVTRDQATVRELILRDLERERLPAQRLRTDHIAPALARLEERRRSAAKVDSVDRHGLPPDDPDVTVVVPLYGRIDFLEHQLAQFVHDPGFQAVDLIYLLDSPELADAFRASATQLAELYDVPFRAVVMSRNVGFSAVNNVGADLARGRLLLLLNSDVLPCGPGWLSAMTSAYDANPGIGALAPKLLFEDGSIQHAGMYFRRLGATGTWSNEHFYKGLDRYLPAANVARAVPAVTAACMMIDLALYRQVGGLRGMFVQGDYEDSDLCLRLMEVGRESWYLPEVELYHLEGQSYPSATRQLTGSYNRWLHTQTWSKEIPRLMEETP